MQSSSSRGLRRRPPAAAPISLTMSSGTMRHCRCGSGSDAFGTFTIKNLSSAKDASQVQVLSKARGRHFGINLTRAGDQCGENQCGSRWERPVSCDRGKYPDAPAWGRTGRLSRRPHVRNRCRGHAQATAQAVFKGLSALHSRHPWCDSPLCQPDFFRRCTADCPG